MTCPYCGQIAHWVDNKAVYGRNFGRSYMMYLCKPCDAYVGCHKNSKTPLGTLANAELRYFRKLAHSKFDVMWNTGRMTRSKAYRFLKKYFGREIHIGEADIETCREIIMLMERV